MRQFSSPSHTGDKRDLPQRPDATARPTSFSSAQEPVPPSPLPHPFMTSSSTINNYYDSNGPGPNAGGYPYLYYEYYADPLNRIHHIHPPGRKYHDEEDGHYIEKVYEANSTQDNIGTPYEYYSEKTRDENGIWSEKWTNKFDEVMGEVIDHPDLVSHELGRKNRQVFTCGLYETGAALCYAPVRFPRSYVMK
jgi:hypothetical protein